MNDIRKDNRLGFWGLTAIVFGSVIGGSIYNIAQSMARGASLGAVLAAWLITGLGMLSLVIVFKRLSDIRPDLTAGIYEYAQVGFGNYAGFNMAWGYWLCVILGNLTYAVMLNDAIDAFFPSMIGNKTDLVMFGTVIIWGMYLMVSRGMRSAAFVNTLLSIVKFASLLLIVAILAICTRIGMFGIDFWGNLPGSGLGSFTDQFSSCMLVTVWSFMGIEGAVMMSGRARRHSDVGRASVTGFLLALVLYVLVSLLCFGVMTRRELSTLPNPSLAYVLDACAGPWAKWYVIVAVAVSILGGFVAWTLVSAQVPCEAARVGIFPRRFLHLNRHGMPAYGMMSASVFMTLCLLLVVTAGNVYIAALNLTALMVVPSYMFCGLYLLKLRLHDGIKRNGSGRIADIIAAAASVIFCIYIIWAGGLKLMAVTSLFYLAGTPFYIKARRQALARDAGNATDTVFTTPQRIALGILVIFAIASLLMLFTGTVRLDS